MTSDAGLLDWPAPPAARTKRQIYVQPGQLAAVAEPSVLITILGSCVAICLWDAQQRLGGMNHFMLPFAPSAQTGTPRFGTVAWTTLLAKMTALGAHPRDLRAGIFGGACVMEAFRGTPGGDIGARNVEIAESQLAAAGITIVQRETGGKHGRKVTFETATGHVTVREL